jgi:hypothetical protein
MTHWLQLVKERGTVGWEPPEQEGPPPISEFWRLGGTAHIDDGSSIVLPGPQPCVWCGRPVRAQIVQRWEARSFREAIWGPGEHYSFDKPYKTPIKMYVVGHPCICRIRPPYAHWILAVRLKKSPGWEDKLSV